MDWKQIETNWAVMARRIRADVQCGLADDGEVLRRRTVKGEATDRAATKQNGAISAGNAQKRNSVSTR